VLRQVMQHHATVMTETMMIEKPLSSFVAWLRKFQLLTFLLLIVGGLGFFVSMGILPPDPNATSVGWFITMAKLLAAGSIFVGLIGAYVRIRD
jgi:hypothetical protein